MDIPAPAPIGLPPAMAILAAPGWEPFLRECAGLHRLPVLMHELGGEKERALVGPRELLEQTRARLAKLEGDGIGAFGKWGAGAVVSNAEEAAHFATGGFTWFTLELARSVDARADGMSLEQLDAAIVALEDRGVYRAGWHEAYVDRVFAPAPGASLRFSDEALARAAVKFGPALALAEEIEQAIRSCWHGRGELPDVAVSLAPSGPATTPEELWFVAMELRARLSGLPALAPALGNRCEPGSESADAAGVAELLDRLAPWAGAAGLLLPAQVGGPGVRVLDATNEGRLALLEALVVRDPRALREWIEAARLAFPLARVGWPISLNEEEARFLPQVDDGELVATFIESVPGRQLLLSTWRDVRGELGKVLPS